MTPDGSDSDEFYELLSQLVDGILDESEAIRLTELLRDNPGRQDLYLSYMRLHAQLHLDYGMAPTQLDMPGVSSMPISDSTPRRFGAEFGGGRRTGNPRGSAAPRRWTAFLALGASATAASLLALLLASRWQTAQPDASLVTTPKVTGSTRVAARDQVAMIVKLDGIRWRGDGSHATEGQVLRKSDRIEIAAGRLTLAFFNGVMLTLEGPAELDLISVDHVYCHQGKIRTHVPSGAEGFVVAAPGSNVTDLGTDFGFNVEASGKAQVMVFEGSANAAVLKGSGLAQRNRDLKTKSALEIDPANFAMKDTNGSDEAFVSSPSLKTPPLTLSAAYRDDVMRLRPWGYWRFDSLDGGAAANEVAGRPPLRVTGPVRLAGGENRSALFGPGVADQYLEMEGSWSPAPDPGYAVELWFAPDRIGLAEIAGLFLPHGGTEYHHLFQLELTSLNRESIVFQRTSVRFLHRWPPAGQGGDNLFSDFYVPHRWHHAVAQLRGDHMELYINGCPTPVLGSVTSRTPVASHLILGQLKPSPRPPQPWESRPFVGQIDEVALYDRPLSQDEIRRHFALGAPQN